MNLFIIGATFDVIGKILIGITVLLVHGRVIRKHKTDRSVIKEMKHERIFGILGIAFVIIGYIIHVYST